MFFFVTSDNKRSAYRALPSSSLKTTFNPQVSVILIKYQKPDLPPLSPIMQSIKVAQTALDLNLKHQAAVLGKLVRKRKLCIEVHRIVLL